MQEFLYLQPLREAVIAMSNLEEIDLNKCQVLVNKIKIKTGKQVSTIAIRRLYGLSPAKFAPTINTLDILALYCGYEDWQNFRRRHVVDFFIKDRFN